ncbi:DUF1819 family protein [Planomicrobium okeanokoites]|uniref:DUF1819 family protein n=1 Tax=Planomicrobium okeanokoites TaxID=244 RepID=UPI00248F6056|nr:DUF1819 family protein [Planomicrobium okeanokoites]
MEIQYKASLNGAAFLLFELKQVVKLKQKSMSSEEIRRKVLEENVFQGGKKSSMSRALTSVIRRAEVIDQTIGEKLLEGSLETSKAINLYSIMKTDLLFYEFMSEVICDKLHNDILLLEKKDINLFFTVKIEQSELVAQWSEVTIKKLKRAYLQVLFESGILKERQGTELNRLVIDEQLKEHLKYIGDAKYVHAMGE